MPRLFSTALESFFNAEVAELPQSFAAVFAGPASLSLLRCVLIHTEHGDTESFASGSKGSLDGTV
jgi:hypothetical protein